MTTALRFSQVLLDSIHAFENDTGKLPSELVMGINERNALWREWHNSLPPELERIRLSPEPHDREVFADVPLKMDKHIYGFILKDAD